MSDFIRRHANRVSLSAFPPEPQTGDTVRLRCQGGRRLRLASGNNHSAEDVILPDGNTAWVETVMPAAPLTISLLDGQGAVLASLRLEPKCKPTHIPPEPAGAKQAKADLAGQNAAADPYPDDVPPAFTKTVQPEQPKLKPTIIRAPDTSKAATLLPSNARSLDVPAQIQARYEGADVLVPVSAIGAMCCEIVLADGQRSLLPAVGVFSVSGPLACPIEVGVIARYEDGYAIVKLVQVLPYIAPQPVKQSWLARLLLSP